MPDATSSARQGRSAERTRLVALDGGREWSRRRDNLPAAISSFVGREAEVTEVVRLLSGNRLLTLTGPGGVGKTRLALAAAAELVEVFDEGPWVVDLSALSDPALVTQAIATSLGVREQPGVPLVTALAEWLRTRTVLVVLDNCEHVLDLCAGLAEVLLPASAGLHILATSREALGITGEVAWPVPPLGLPDPSQLDIDFVRRVESVRLFVERAVAVNPSFAVTAQNAAWVARIVGQLDGIPLALELAAARVKVLSVQEISRRLNDCFEILGAGGRSMVARHRTLHATIQWSYDLLSDEERRLFRRLSVFVGGFTLLAAESVCPDGADESAEVLRVLSQLVDKSLVEAQERVGETRYRMLETVRQYAREQLVGSADAETVARRHTYFFAGLAENAERDLFGPDHSAWVRRFELEHDNFRAALAWSLRQDGDVGVRLASSLGPFWFVRGYLSEGRHWLVTTTGRAGPEADRWSAKALTQAALLAGFAEDYDEAKGYGEQGLALNRHLDDPEGIAFSLVILGTIAVAGQRGDIPAASLLDEARSLLPNTRDARIRAQLLDLDGAIALIAGDVDRAVSLWEQSRQISRGLGNAYGEAISLANLGLLAVRMGDARAEGLLQDGLRVGLELDYKLVIQYCWTGLGALAAADGRLARAARLWGAAEGIGETFGTQLTRAARAVIDYAARLATARSQLDDAVWDAAWSEGRAMDPGRVASDTEDLRAPAVVQLPGGLSTREAEILGLVAEGSTNAEVAQQLFLSPRTVDWHLSSIYTKLDIHSRAEATRYAVNHGLA